MPNYGALPGEWEHLSLLLGLTADLLPVVSNPGAKISPQSKMQAVGKTPSRYNRQKEAAGIAAWTQQISSEEEIAAWEKQPDYGICIQTRTVRAIDIDVADPVVAASVADLIEKEVGALPTRMRGNSSKCLLAFTLPGDMPKRVIKLEGGIIEFLATGQQFIACGTHPSGVRYEWVGGLPLEIPPLSNEQFEALWSKLAHTFGTSDTVSTSPSRARVLNEALSNDPVATYLSGNGWVKSSERSGALHITCPFEAEHSGPSAISATTYFPPNTGGYAQGHFKCLHAHCEQRSDDEFKHAIGMPYEDPFNDFEDCSHTVKDQAEAPKGGRRFTVVPAHEFGVAVEHQWIIKKVIPKGELVVIYGESGSGKSFFVNDLAYAIAQGAPWRGNRVTRGRVVIIAAEGATGMRNRLRAYSRESGVDLLHLGIGVIPDAPNFMQVQDVKDVIQSVRAFGEVSVVVVDTFAQVMAGSNENAGEDVGKALAHCKQIHKHTGATVILIHHAGKDASKGARGWSGLRAAADAEIEVSRCDEDRVATITKMKDGQDGLDFGFRLKTVTLGVDLDSEDITSCVLEETAATKRTKGAATKKGANEKLALRCLSEMLGADNRVDYTTLINGMMNQMTPPLEGKRDRRGEIAKQALDALREKGEIRVENGFIMYPGDAE